MLKAIAVIHFAPESERWLGLAGQLSLRISPALVIMLAGFSSLTRLALGLRRLSRLRARTAEALWTSLPLYVLSLHGACRVALLLGLTSWLTAPRGRAPRGTSRGCMPF